MTRLCCVAIVRPIEIGRHHGQEVCAILFIVEMTLDGAHALSVGVAFVRGVGWTCMQRGSLDGVLSLVWVNASAEHANKLFDVMSVRGPNDIAIHCKVFLEKPHLIVHVCIETAHFCS